MKKAWSGSGLRNVTPGASTPHSARRIGNIPIVSKFFVKMRISSAEKAINKLEEGIKIKVEKARSKVDSIVAAAKKTDSANLIEKAKGLQDRLERASCQEPDFAESDGEGGGGGRSSAKPKLSPAQKQEIKIKCVKAGNEAAGVIWGGPTGRATNKEYPVWRDAYDACFRELTGD